MPDMLGGAAAVVKLHNGLKHKTCEHVQMNIINNAVPSHIYYSSDILFVLPEQTSIIS